MLGPTRNIAQPEVDFESCSPAWSASAKSHSWQSSKESPTKPSMKTSLLDFRYATSLCKAISHSIDHLVTLDARLCVALRRSGLAMRAANKIFIKIFDAMGCNLPGFSSSQRVGLAIPASVNGVGTFGKSSFLTFASSQYASTQESMKEDMSYRTRFTGFFIQPFLSFTTFSMLRNL